MVFKAQFLSGFKFFIRQWGCGYARLDCVSIWKIRRNYGVVNIL